MEDHTSPKTEIAAPILAWFPEKLISLEVEFGVVALILKTRSLGTELVFVV